MVSKIQKKNIDRGDRIQIKGASSAKVNGKWMDY